MSRSQRLTASHQDVPAGWPRPHYLDDLAEEAPDPAGAPGRAAVRYAQWSSESMGAQINACHPDRTYLAGACHLCSCCGQQMSLGLVFDAAWVNANRDAPAEAASDLVYSASVLTEHDTHYGSPICLRCAVFALKHCPYFSVFDHQFGDRLVWVVLTEAGQYTEFDETTAIKVNDPFVVPRLTSGEVRAEVRAGRLHLGPVTPADLPGWTRPYDIVDGGRMLTRLVPKFDREQVAALAAVAGG